MKDSKINPLHPGQVLEELYLKPTEMSAGSLAKKLFVPRTRIERIVKGQTGLSPDTALRLARFFNTTPRYWLNMQIAYDLHQEEALRKSDLEKIVAA